MDAYGERVAGHRVPSGRRRLRRAQTAVVVLTGVVAAGCGVQSPAAHHAANLTAPRSSSVGPTTPTALPAVCRAPRRLAPVVAAGPAPSGFHRLDWVQATLTSRFPTVWGGLVATGPQGEQLVFQETAHDAFLESEVRQNFPAPVFSLVPFSAACLQSVNSAISPLVGRQNDPLRLMMAGIGKDRVQVGSTVCAPAAASMVQRWFRLRYGDTVTVATCQTPPVADPATATVPR